jgi:hypothetical protein
MQVRFLLMTLLLLDVYGRVLAILNVKNVSVSDDEGKCTSMFGYN